MEILSHIAAAKAQEYIIAVVFLVAFVFYWRLISAPAPSTVPVAEALRRTVSSLGELVGGFLVPEQIYFHPGHAWLKVERENVVRVGMDDFAHKLVGQADSIRVPAVGSTLKQGEPAWTLYRDQKAVDMLSPVDGKIISINREAMSSPETVSRDPYGRGWLIQVESPNISANLKNLLSGSLARKWTEGVRESLLGMSHQSLGLVYQDGGVPMMGMAANLDRGQWDEIARDFLLTSEKTFVSSEETHAQER